MENTSKNALNLDEIGESATEKADRLRLEGNESFRVNDFKKAIDLYTKSLEAKKTVPALLNRSFSYTKIERYEEALLDADEALKMEPDNLKGKCRRGIALRELGRYAPALKEFGACLEQESNSASFQQLYDLCQALADQKSFVNMKLQIVGYKDPTSGRELKLELADGLPCFPHIEHKAQRFQSLTHLEAHIKEHVKGAFGSIRIEDSVVDEELMQFFRSWDPVMFASSYVEFYNVRCSAAQFTELFDGNLLRPLGIWLSRMERTEMDLTTALHSLAALRNAKSLQLNETRFDRFYNVCSKTNMNKNGALLDVDIVLDLLHEPHPDIPAHTRASPTFFARASSSSTDSVIRGERTLTATEGVTMLRGLAGRMFNIDLLNHFGDGKLDEIIQKCTQRFRSASSPVSYMCHLRVPLLLERLKQNPADSAVLAKFLQQDRSIVLYNGVGEQLTLGVVLCPFKPDVQVTQGEPNGQIATVIVQRIHAPTTKESDKR